MAGPKRTILFSTGELEMDNINEIVNTIVDVNAYDDEQEKSVVDYKREPIKMIINTYGGSAYGMLAAVSAMKSSKTPIHTYGYGCIMSAGMGLYLMGHKRFADDTTTFMYHGVGYGTWGTIPHHERELNQMKLLQKYYDNIILDNSNLTKSELEDTVNASKYMYLSGTEGIKRGIVDELITEGLKRERK